VSTTARIRGIGTVGDNIGLESSVGVVIDGVYRSANGVVGDLGEIERIEVLKGPQGTLFGKNTSAGVVNVITKRPQFEFGSDVELTGASLGELDASGSLTGTIIDNKLAARISVTRRKRDGFYDVSTGGGPRTDTQDANRDVIAARGQLLFMPSASTSALFIADYARRNESCCAAVQIRRSDAMIDARADSGRHTGRPTPSARVAFLDGGTNSDKGLASSTSTLRLARSPRSAPGGSSKPPSARMRTTRRATWCGAIPPVRTATSSTSFRRSCASRARPIASTGWWARSTPPRASIRT
jgi:outer membrane receptor protein involved in Fe transport